MFVLKHFLYLNMNEIQIFFMFQLIAQQHLHLSIFVDYPVAFFYEHFTKIYINFQILLNYNPMLKS